MASSPEKTKLPTKLFKSFAFLTCTTNPLKEAPGDASRENSSVPPGVTRALVMVMFPGGGELDGSCGSLPCPGTMREQAVSGAPRPKLKMGCGRRQREMMETKLEKIIVVGRI
jgi:hypothetical protein